VSKLEERFRRARSDPALAVLEGFHALKHALRFGADIVVAVAADPTAALDLAAAVAPDVADPMAGLLQPGPPDGLRDLAPAPPPTGVLAIAVRPSVDGVALVRSGGDGPLVALIEPRHLGNVGAVVRVAAAAGAAGVVTTGTADPWHPAALRGSAGLHFALPVARLDALPPTERLLVAVDPAGDPLRRDGLPDDGVFAFGSERHGLDAALLERADRSVAIPMRAGVSSLNLATAVAVVLYADLG
jgi:TrmH family RNA methyltransferase